MKFLGEALVGVLNRFGIGAGIDAENFVMVLKFSGQG
jgi:hypothetical protein